MHAPALLALLLAACALRSAAAASDLPKAIVAHDCASPDCKTGRCIVGACLDVGCSGGLCEFTEAVNPTCGGGACTFTRCVNPTCDGGSCRHVDPASTLRDGYCEGGACLVNGEKWPRRISLDLTE